MNTVFFLGFIALFFFNTEIAGLNVIAAVVIPALSINFVIEIIACGIIGFSTEHCNAENFAGVSPKTVKV